jgi:ATP-binding cassette, subfamily C, type I secretion system permease/ATPase
VFSGMSNILMLTGSLFMLEVYDRVIPSRSVPTLVALLILAGGLYAAQGIIDAIRSRILVRVGNSLDEALSLRVYDAIVRLPLRLGGRGEGAQPIRDLDTVRGFLSGTGPIALFDLPWLPVYLAICFLFHTYIGLTALAGAIILVSLALLTEVLTRRPTRSATQFAAARNTLMEAAVATRRPSQPWAWPAVSPSTRAISTATTLPAAPARATSPVVLGQCRRFCA